ncbi:MAG: hypothetical protein U5O15_10625 [Candidatus Krumholzibacteriota bacterium]|nr:hypothetical protein [Candidatus Krumholzibacteriota bacterium]
MNERRFLGNGEERNIEHNASESAFEKSFKEINAIIKNIKIDKTNPIFEKAQYSVYRKKNTATIIEITTNLRENIFSIERLFNLFSIGVLILI